MFGFSCDAKMAHHETIQRLKNLKSSDIAIGLDPQESNPCFWTEATKIYIKVCRGFIQNTNAGSRNRVIKFFVVVLKNSISYHLGIPTEEIRCWKVIQASGDEGHERCRPVMNWASEILEDINGMVLVGTTRKMVAPDDVVALRQSFARNDGLAMEDHEAGPMQSDSKSTTIKQASAVVAPRPLLKDTRMEDAFVHAFAGEAEGNQEVSWKNTLAPEVAAFVLETFPTDSVPMDKVADVRIEEEQRIAMEDEDEMAAASRDDIVGPKEISFLKAKFILGDATAMEERVSTSQYQRTPLGFVIRPQQVHCWEDNYIALNERMTPDQEVQRIRQYGQVYGIPTASSEWNEIAFA